MRQATYFAQSRPYGLLRTGRSSLGPIYWARTNGSLRLWPEEFCIKLNTGKGFSGLDDALVRVGALPPTLQAATHS
jgi:hypothetical protein